jgi:hypothetical protein
MYGREWLALIVAVVLLAAADQTPAARECSAPLEAGTWREAAPIVNPVAELQKRGSTPTDMLASVALPGWGELRTGRKQWAIAHMAAEASIWVSFAVFRVQGKLRKDDFIEYAEVFGGVQQAGGQSQEYYRSLARYRRSDPGPDSYNEKEVRETARVFFPDDSEARKRYIEEHEISGPLAWQWESDAHWRNFAVMRASSERSFQRSRFCIAAAITNRIASVLGLARSRGPGGTQIDVGMNTLGGDGYPSPTVSVRMSF